MYIWKILEFLVGLVLPLCSVVFVCDGSLGRTPAAAIEGSQRAPRPRAPAHETSGSRGSVFFVWTAVFNL